MVNLTRIYTRTGDDGTTALGDLSRTSKNDPRLVAFADVDEANSALGVVLSMTAQLGAELGGPMVSLLGQVQNDLFDVGADLCNPIADDPPYPPLRITEEYVTRLEGWCDEYNDRLPALDSFVLPGGTPGAALLHVARTVARRAERSTWTLMAADPDRTSDLPAKYLNRLSDLLFILARTANPTGDVKWVPGGKR
jgi:cob(I)alamin adenosyltransferase